MESSEFLNLDHLARTWILDLDGTLVWHNCQLTDASVLLPGVWEFFQNLPDQDVVVILTARTPRERGDILRFFNGLGIRVDHVICGASHGLRTLVNDRKPDGTATARGVNVIRDQGDWHWDL